MSGEPLGTTREPSGTTPEPLVAEIGQRMVPAASHSPEESEAGNHESREPHRELRNDSTNDDITSSNSTLKKTPRRTPRRKGGKGGRKHGKRSSTALQTFNLTTKAIGLLHPDATKQKALAGYLKHGTITAACAAAGVDRKTWYNWIDADGEFKELAADAHEATVDALEQVARRRATKAKDASDTLLIFLLKAHRRGKFGDRQTITLFSPEIQVALRSTIELIGSRPSWDSHELLDLMEAFWK